MVHFVTKSSRLVCSTTMLMFLLNSGEARAKVCDLNSNKSLLSELKKVDKGLGQIKIETEDCGTVRVSWGVNGQGKVYFGMGTYDNYKEEISTEEIKELVRIAKSHNNKKNNRNDKAEVASNEESISEPTEVSAIEPSLTDSAEKPDSTYTVRKYKEKTLKDDSSSNKQSSLIDVED